jgi:hypothetical protein
MTTSDENLTYSTKTAAKQDIYDYVHFGLGGGMVDVELDPEHYEQAYKAAMLRYRQRSSNALEDSYSFLQLEVDQNYYTLPDEVITVRQVFKRNIGANAGTSSQYEPFEAGFVNFYMIQSGRVGGLATYYMYSSYLEEAAKMFGGFINFQYNRVTKQLTIMRRPRADLEQVLLWTHNYKPDFSLLQDTYALPWIRDYTLGRCKIMLGEAREKFASLPGPGGGTTLNGTALKQEGQAIIDRLEAEVSNYVDGSDPMWFVIG